MRMLWLSVWNCCWNAPIRNWSKRNTDCSWKRPIEDRQIKQIHSRSNCHNNRNHLSVLEYNERTKMHKRTQSVNKILFSKLICILMELLATIRLNSTHLHIYTIEFSWKTYKLFKINESIYEIFIALYFPLRFSCDIKLIQKFIRKIA